MMLGSVFNRHQERQAPSSQPSSSTPSSSTHPSSTQPQFSSSSSSTQPPSSTSDSSKTAIRCVLRSFTSQRNRHPYSEYQGHGPPQASYGQPGDIYLDLTPGKMGLYGRGEEGWVAWSVPEETGDIGVKGLVRHPGRGVERYLWGKEDGYGWYARNHIFGSEGMTQSEILSAAKDHAALKLKSNTRKRKSVSVAEDGDGDGTEADDGHGGARSSKKAHTAKPGSGSGSAPAATATPRMSVSGSASASGSGTVAPNPSSTSTQLQSGAVRHPSQARSVRQTPEGPTRSNPSTSPTNLFTHPNANANPFTNSTSNLLRRSSLTQARSQTQPQAQPQSQAQAQTQGQLRAHHSPPRASVLGSSRTASTSNPNPTSLPPHHHHHLTPLIESIQTTSSPSPVVPSQTRTVPSQTNTNTNANASTMYTTTALRASPVANEAEPGPSRIPHDAFELVARRVLARARDLAQSQEWLWPQAQGRVPANANATASARNSDANDIAQVPIAVLIDVDSDEDENKAESEDVHAENGEEDEDMEEVDQLDTDDHDEVVEVEDEDEVVEISPPPPTTTTTAKAKAKTKAKTRVVVDLTQTPTTNSDATTASSSHQNQHPDPVSLLRSYIQSTHAELGRLRQVETTLLSSAHQLGVSFPMGDKNPSTEHQQASELTQNQQTFDFTNSQKLPQLTASDVHLLFASLRSTQALELKGSTASLEWNLAQAHAELQKHQSELQQTSTELERTRQSRQTDLTQLSEVQKTLAEAHREIENLKETNRSDTLVLHQTTAGLNRMVEHSRRQEAEHGETQAELARTREALGRVKDDLCRETLVLSEVREEMGHMRYQTQVAEVDRKNVKGVMEGLVKERNGAVDALATTRGEVVRLNQLCETTSGNLARVLGEVRDLKEVGERERRWREVELDGVKEEFVKLKEQSAREDEEYGRMKAALEEMEREKMAVEGEVARLRDENEELQEENKKLKVHAVKVEESMVSMEGDDIGMDQMAEDLAATQSTLSQSRTQEEDHIGSDDPVLLSPTTLPLTLLEELHIYVLCVKTEYGLFCRLCLGSDPEAIKYTFEKGPEWEDTTKRVHDHHVSEHYEDYKCVINLPNEELLELYNEYNEF